MLINTKDTTSNLTLNKPQPGSSAASKPSASQRLRVEPTTPAPDPAAFARALGFLPDPKQHLVLTCGARRGLLNCARQWGKSTVTAILALHRALTRPDSLVLVVSPSLRQSAEFLRKISVFIRRLGLPRKKDGQNSVSLLFDNGSRIVGLPGREDTVRGFSAVSLLLVDEAARVPQELYFSLRPTLAVADGDLWLMSTPNGQSGFFYDAWCESEIPSKTGLLACQVTPAEKSGPKKPSASLRLCVEHTPAADAWTRIAVPATECPRISAKFLDEERRALGDARFQQEYLCQFGQSEDAWFPPAIIGRAFAPAAPIRFSFDEDHTGGPRDVHLLDPPAGLFGRHDCFFVGVDLGQVHDPTAIAILERNLHWFTARDPVTWAPHKAARYTVRYLERVPLGTPYTEIGTRVQTIVHGLLPVAPVTVVVDATGVGAPVTDILRDKRLGCPVVPIVITGAEQVTYAPPLWRVPKLELLERTRLMLEQEILKVAAKLPEAGRLQTEMTRMRIRLSEAGKVVWREGAHDDLVFAVALAAWKSWLKDQPIMPHMPILENLKLPRDSRPPQHRIV